jgi:hypothetical protein
MTDGTGTCLITLPVMEFNSTISGVNVETASVLEGLSVFENVVTDAEGLQGVTVLPTKTQNAYHVPVIPLIGPPFAPCTYAFR